MTSSITEAEFEPELTSARAARSLVMSVLDPDDPSTDSAELVISELATNAILHARTRFVVRVLRGDGRVRVEVGDGNPLPPVTKDYGSDATTGRGLHIVARLADRWGVTPRPEGGKTAWAEFDLTHSRDDASAPRAPAGAR